MSESTPGPLLHIQSLSAAYRVEGGYLPAVRNWNLLLGRGEVLGLLGESGCGKTTAALALMGLLPASAQVSGSVRFQGMELIGAGEAELEKIRGAQISFIPQEPLLSLNPVIRVVDQVAEVLRAHRRLSAAEYQDRARIALEHAGLKARDLQQAYPHQLSGGQRQRVLIAQAIVCGPALVIADEPTSALDPVSTREIVTLLLSLVRGLNASLVLITHDPRILSATADRVIVMHDGTIVEAGPAQEVLRSVRSPIRGLPVPADKPTDAGAAAVLGTRGVTKSYHRRSKLTARHEEVPAVRGVDLELQAGRTLAVVGPSGAGKSTLARLMAGLEKPDAGEILVDGRELGSRALHRRIQMIFQDPGASLNPRFTVAEALAEPLAVQGRRSNLAAMLQRVGLPENALSRRTSQLSGGQKARLAVARALAALSDRESPCVLILDESLASLDLSVKAQMIQLLMDLQRQRSLAYVLIAHDLSVAIHMADEVAVVSDGRIVERGSPRELQSLPHSRFSALAAAQALGKDV